MSADSEQAPTAPPPAASPTDARTARLRRELRALAAAGVSRQELLIHLAAAGYDPGRATVMLDQLADDSAEGQPPAPAATASPAAAESALADPGGPALRVWAPFERARFSPEAWGQLLRFRTDGMGDGEFEHLVDRALLQLDGPVGVPELRGLLGESAGSAAAPPTVH